MQIIKYKYYFLLLSALVLIPGIISLIVFGLRLSIDFTGGSLVKYQFQQNIDTTELKGIFSAQDITVENIVNEGANEISVRTKPIETTKIDALKTAVSAKYPNSVVKSFETVGPTIGQETTKNAFVSLTWASVGILLYIAYAFRNIPKPYSSFRFGVSAIIAMLHDAFILLGVFSLFGHFFKLEIDGLFITAVLTVIGFSVHDTIVVFDRIRENLNKLPRTWGFEQIVNFSIVETLNRSLATSFTVVLTLSALFLLGGESIRSFVLAMLIGIISGTYSSIFTAAPLLVIWENFILKKKAKQLI
jgi:preprotein translocase subunit SecF